MGEQKRYAIQAGGRDGAPLWKIVNGSNRVIAYCLRETDAEQVVNALKQAASSAEQIEGGG